MIVNYRLFPSLNESMLRLKLLVQLLIISSFCGVYIGTTLKSLNYSFHIAMNKSS